MKKQHWCFAEQGEVHKSKNILCEDKVISGEKRGMQYIALADGAGSLKYCAAGAMCAIKAIVEYVSDNFERLLSESLVKTRYIIVNHVLYSIKENYKENNLKEFGSTLLFVGVKDGKYILFHLGDGIITVRCETDFRVISSPMNGISKKHTFLTTTCDSYKYVRLLRGENKYSAFLVASDGCSDEIVKEGKTVSDNIVQKLNTYNSKREITNYLNSKNLQDDYSMAFMTM